MSLNISWTLPRIEVTLAGQVINASVVKTMTKSRSITFVFIHTNTVTYALYDFFAFQYVLQPFPQLSSSMDQRIQTYQFVSKN